ncbi:hypothetical protein KSS87_011541, partial [Heliosperma pusillum]
MLVALCHLFVTRQCISIPNLSVCRFFVLYCTGFSQLRVQIAVLGRCPNSGNPGVVEMWCLSLLLQKLLLQAIFYRFQHGLIGTIFIHCTLCVVYAFHLLLHVAIFLHFLT